VIHELHESTAPIVPAEVLNLLQFLEIGQFILQAALTIPSHHPDVTPFVPKLASSWVPRHNFTSTNLASFAAVWCRCRGARKTRPDVWERVGCLFTSRTATTCSRHPRFRIVTCRRSISCWTRRSSRLTGFPALRSRSFSVALSSRSRALDVIQQVWSFGSSDFPRNH